MTANCSFAVTDSTLGKSNKNTVKAMRSVHADISREDSPG